MSTEIVERSKAQNVLDALLTQLPAEVSDDAIAAAIARRLTAMSGSNQRV